jgi:hypothetical protein
MESSAAVHDLVGRPERGSDRRAITLRWLVLLATAAVGFGAAFAIGSSVKTKSAPPANSLATVLNNQAAQVKVAAPGAAASLPNLKAPPQKPTQSAATAAPTTSAPAGTPAVTPQQTYTPPASTYTPPAQTSAPPPSTPHTTVSPSNPPPTHTTAGGG